MEKKLLILLFIGVAFCYSCSSSTSTKAKEISEGVYRQSDWVFDLKKLDGKDIVPYYTVSKSSDNAITTEGSKLQSRVKISFKINKGSEAKGEILGIYFESTVKDENKFKFPRCLSVCPVNIEILSEAGITRSKSFYNRNNVFQMQMVDEVIKEFVLSRKNIRVRIPVSIDNQNTTFKWFEFDLSNYTSKLKL